MIKTDWLTFHECVCLKGELWACSNRFSSYFRINPVNGATTFEGWGEFCEKIGCRIFTIGIYKNYLVSASRFGDYIELIDTENRKRKICELDYQKVSRKDEYYFFVVERYFIVSSIMGKETFIFDLERLIAAGENKPIKKLIHKFDIITKPALRGKTLLYFKQDEAIIEAVYLKDWSVKAYAIKDKNVGIVDLFISDAKIFLLFVNGDVAIYKKDTNELLEYYKNTEQNCVYVKFYIAADRLWIFPGTKGDIFIIDLKTKSVCTYTCYPEDFKFLFSEPHPKYASFSEDDRFIYIGQRSTNYMMVIDKVKGNEKWISVMFPKKYFEEELQKVIANNIGTNMIENQSLMVLRHFLSYIKWLENCNRIEAAHNCTIGHSIYGWMKKIDE